MSRPIVSSVPCVLIPFIGLNLGNTGGGDALRPIKKTEHICLYGIDATGTPHSAAGAMRWHGHIGGYQRFVCPEPQKGLKCPHAATCPKRSAHLNSEMSLTAGTPRMAAPP